MKKYSFVIALIGLVLIFGASTLFFRNSNKKVDMGGPKVQIDALSKEIDELVITDKIESTRKLETEISEIKISINILDGRNFEMYKDKEISLYDYYVNNKQIKKYNKLVEDLEKKIEQKLK